MYAQKLRCLYLGREYDWIVGGRHVSKGNSRHKGRRTKLNEEDFVEAAMVEYPQGSRSGIHR